MTPKEEAEMLALEIELADHPHEQPPAAQPSMGAAALAGVQNLGTFGWGDELGAAMQGGLAKLTGTGDYGDTYRAARDENRAESKAAKDAHPVAYYAAGLPAGLASSLAVPTLKAAQGAGLGVRALYGLGNGALQGGLAGAGESNADTLGGVAEDAGIGAGIGGIAGGALPLAGAGLRGAVRGVIRPGPIVDELGRLGVDTERMTLGQMNPGGKMAQIEEAGQHAVGSGNVIKGQREGGLRAWRDAVMNRQTPPYQPLAGGGAPEQLAAGNHGYRAAYGAIGQNPVLTAGEGQQSVADQLRGSFRAAVDNPAILSTDADRVAMSRYLENQASALRHVPGETRTVGDLQGVRSDIRRTLSKALGGAAPDQARGDMLQGAEKAVTGQIEQNLPPSEREALKMIDRRYAEHKVIEDAVARAGDKPEGLTPLHLSAAIKADMERGAYARGGGGDLRDLANLGREAFQDKTPPTGVRALISAIPVIGHNAQAPIAAVANMSPVKQALLGQTAAQLRAQALIEALRGTAALRSMAAEDVGGAAAREATRLRPYFFDGGSISAGPGGAVASRNEP